MQADEVIAGLALFAALDDRQDGAHRVAHEPASCAMALAYQFKLPVGTNQACAEANDQQREGKRLHDVTHGCPAI